MNDITTKYSWQIDKYVLIGEQGALNRVWQSAPEARALSINYHPHENRVTVNYGRGELESLLVGGEDMHPLAWCLGRQLYVVKRSQLDGSTISKFRIYFHSPQDCQSFVNRMPEIWEIRHSEKPAPVQSTGAASVEVTDWNDPFAFYKYLVDFPLPQFPPVPPEVQHELEKWAADSGGSEGGEGPSRGYEDDDSGGMCSPLYNAPTHFDVMDKSVPRKKLPSMKPKKRKPPRKSSPNKPKTAAETSANGAPSSTPTNWRQPRVTNVGDGVLTRRMSALQAATSGNAADAVPTEQVQRQEQNETNTAELLEAISAILPDEWSAEGVDVPSLTADDIDNFFNASTASAIGSSEPTPIDYDDLFTTWSPTMSIGSLDSAAGRGGPTSAEGAMGDQVDGAQAEPVDALALELFVGASVESEGEAVAADPHMEEERSESLAVDEDSSLGSIDSKASTELGLPIASPSSFQLVAVGDASSESPEPPDADDETEVCSEVLNDATIGLIAKHLSRSIVWDESLRTDRRDPSLLMKTRSGRTHDCTPARKDAGSKPPTKKRQPLAKSNGPTAKKRRAAKRIGPPKRRRYEMREKRPPSRLLSSDEYELGP